MHGSSVQSFLSPRSERQSVLRFGWSPSWTVRALPLIALALLFPGCSSCNQSREVPFGLDKEAAEAKSVSATDERADEAAQEETVFKALESLTLEPGTDRVRVAGDEYGAPAGSSIHLLLELNGGAEGNASAFILESDETHYRMKILERRDGTLRPSEFKSLDRAEDCAFKKGGLSLPAPNFVLYNLTEECAFGEGSAGGVANLIPSPRIRKAIRIAAPRNEDEKSFSLSLRGIDRDEDGYTDLTAELHAEGMEALTLNWLNRPGGFMLVDLEPKQTLERLEEIGRSAVEPSAAAHAARSLLRLSTALCRESEAPRLTIDEHRGLSCGKNYARVAEGLIVGELLLRGELDEALSLARDLRERGDEELNAILRDAFKLLPASAISLSRLPLPGSLDGDAWLRGLAFDEEGALLIGGSSPTKVDLSSEEPVIVPSDEAPYPARDLLDRYGLVSIETACYGSRVGVRALRQDEGAPPRTKLIPIDDGSGCAPGAPKEEPWEVVGWAPQGVVVERGKLRRIVPLDVEAAPAGQPFDLGEEEPLPSPILGPRVSRDGEARLIAIPSALIVLRDGKPNLVLRHEAWGESPEIRAAALSPSGDRVAAVVGNDLYFGKLSGR